MSGIFSKRRPDPTAVKVVKALGWGRMAIGVTGAAWPSSWSGWLGPVAKDPAVQVAIRGLAGRDILLGFLAVHVAETPGVGSRTAAAMAAVDAGDLVGTLLASRALSRSAVIATAATAGGAAAAGFWAAKRLDD